MIIIINNIVLNTHPTRLPAYTTRTLLKKNPARRATPPNVSRQNNKIRRVRGTSLILHHVFDHTTSRVGH